MHDLNPPSTMFRKKSLGGDVHACFDGGGKGLVVGK